MMRRTQKTMYYVAYAYNTSNSTKMYDAEAILMPRKITTLRDIATLQRHLQEQLKKDVNKSCRHIVNILSFCVIENYY